MVSAERVEEFLKLLGSVATGSTPDWLTFTPDSKFVYVANAGENYVSAVDTQNLREVARIAVSTEKEWYRDRALVSGFHPPRYCLPIGIILRSKLAPSRVKLCSAGRVGERLEEQDARERLTRLYQL